MSCIPLTTCDPNYTCHPVWETCGGTLNCDALFPGQGLVSHINNCSGQACGPPCAPGITPTPILPGEPTPTPQPGTIRARAMQVSAPHTSCADIANGAGITGAAFSFSPSSASHPAPVPPTQIGTGYVTFSGAAPGSYTIIPDVPAQYTVARYCSGGTQVAQSQTLASASTVTWDIGYTPGTPWSQAAGGEVYAATTLRSAVPVLASPRAFILNGTTGGYPGVATYGTEYTFDSTGVTRGQTWVSSKNWLVNDTSPATDFYQLLYTQFGGAPGTVDYVSPVSPVTQPASRAAPYYVTGAMTTSGAWSVGATDTLVFFVDGSLTITGNITIAPGGFAAFIVNGTITIDPAVSAVQGIYITSPAGTFTTGTGSVRLTGTGMFVAGNFSLQRDLGDALNTTTPSELFVYNPQLLLTMPEKMKQMRISWEEVAP